MFKRLKKITAYRVLCLEKYFLDPTSGEKKPSNNRRAGAKVKNVYIAGFAKFVYDFLHKTMSEEVIEVRP